MNKEKEKLDVEVEEKEEESLREIVETYLKENDHIPSFEATRGVENLEFVVQGLGYEEDGCKYGDPISNFLADNPGCVEGIFEWIYRYYENEIRDKLAMED